MIGARPGAPRILRRLGIGGLILLNAGLAVIWH